MSFSTPARTIAPPDAGSGRRVTAVVIGFATVLIMTFGFGPHLDLAVMAASVLVAGCLLLWQAGQSPILAMTFCLHWVGASVAVFHAHWLGIDLARYSQFNGDLHQATLLSLLGIFCVAVGMRLGTGKPKPDAIETTRRIALAHPVRRWFGLYCVASLVSFTALAFVWVVPGLSQVMLAVVALRWAFFFVLAYAAFVRGGLSGPYLPLAFCFELAMGIGGFFSDFRTVFLFTICAAFASGMRLTPRMQAGLAALVASLVALTVVWTGVKTEYRKFVSDGQNAQIVAVDYMTRVGRLAEMVGALEAREIEAGFDAMLRRLAYVDFFSVVLGHVPASIPHENGALLTDSLTRPFLPRALFPEKSIIDDTERTNYYTGGLAGQSDATSISIGYVGEAYIDFGASGMMVALFGIGWAYGCIYRLLSRSRAAGGLLGMGMATAVLQTIGNLEASFTKVAGGLAVCMLVGWLILKFVVPLWLSWAAAPSGGR